MFNSPDVVKTRSGKSSLLGYSNIGYVQHLVVVEQHWVVLGRVVFFCVDIYETDFF